MAIAMVPYDAIWPLEFIRACGEVTKAMGPSLLAIHHIGSMSIPGTYAKPVTAGTFPRPGHCNNRTLFRFFRVRGHGRRQLSVSGMFQLRARKESDVRILVSANGPPGCKRFSDLAHCVRG